ncbi:MAG: threonine synthase [Deltaproteobacteria bacterium]|nr:threonine synthase [Deltaproteobacteria bacterium]
MQPVGLIARYAKYLLVTDKTPRITLGEGSTPLVPAPHLSKLVGADVHLKLEGCNPTGSFKDRGMFLAIAKAMEAGSQAVVCASTGNTSASAAAFAARAGLRCYVLVPDGNIAMGKLAQAVILGARVLQIHGNFDQALDLVRTLGERRPITVVNSINPFRIEGQKTASFEICESLGDAPDLHFLPVGNAGNITAYWKGYREAVEHQLATRTPKMMGYQAAGSAPIVLGKKVDEPKTVATAIKIGNPASWKQALAARDESGGFIGMCTDEKILEAYELLATREGIFCEPASAASVAGLLQAHGEGKVPKGARIACTLTGNGLKDPDIAIARAPAPTKVAADYDALLKAIG